MKMIGLLGGMSWESSAHYYQRLNQLVAERLGGTHSARLLLHSVDFEIIRQYQHAGGWDATADILVDAARGLESAGAEALLICANTMHIVAPQVQQSVRIPLLHIADATAKAVQSTGLDTIGLLGTRFTMEMDFYREWLEQKYGLRVIIPGAMERQEIHRIIFEELCLGRVLEDSRNSMQQIIGQLAHAGAQGIILGCTEFSLLINQSDTSIPVFDTTEIHARAAVDWALDDTVQ